jgi:hypothetical protein
LLDISSTSRKEYLKYCGQVEDILNDDQCNPQNIVVENIPYMYKINAEFFRVFIDNFFINKKIFNSKFHNINDKIRIYDMDKILTSRKISERELKAFIFNIKDDPLTTELIHNNIQIKKESEAPSAYQLLKTLMIKKKNHDFADMFDACTKEFIGNDPMLLENKKLFKSKTDFCSAILMFWSSSRSVLPGEKYIIHVSSNTEVPKSSTCANKLILPEKIENIQQLYNIFMKIFVLDDQQSFSYA